MCWMFQIVGNWHNPAGPGGQDTQWIKYFVKIHADNNLDKQEDSL